MKNRYFIILMGIILAAGVYGLFRDSSNKQEENQANLAGTKFFYPEGSIVATSGTMVITSSIQVLATSTSLRTSAQICNTDSVPVYLSFRRDAVPTTGAFDYYLAAATCFEINAYNGLYQGAVRASSTDDGSTLTISEFQI